VFVPLRRAYKLCKEFSFNLGGTNFSATHSKSKNMLQNQ